MVFVHDVRRCRSNDDDSTTKVKYQISYRNDRTLRAREQKRLDAVCVPVRIGTTVYDGMNANADGIRPPNLENRGENYAGLFEHVLTTTIRSVPE